MASNHTDLFSYNSVSYVANIQVSSGWVPFEDSREGSLTLKASGDCQQSLGCGQVTLISASIFTSPSPPSVSNFPVPSSYKDSCDYKIVRYILTKHGQTLYIENYKMFMKEIKEGVNK